MTAIEKLAEQVGFHASYINIFGDRVHASDDSRKALLEAMGFKVDSEEEIEQSLTHLRDQQWLKVLQPTEIIKAENKQHSVSVTVSEAQKRQNCSWTIVTETGQKLTASVDLNSLSQDAEHRLGNVNYFRCTLVLPQLPEGYHTLEVTIGKEDKEHQEKSFLIVAPKTCYSPKDAADFKMWGIAAQLYSLYSDSCWGIGDFGDLKKLVTEAAPRGVSTIGLNPLHPLFPGNPAHRSPYSPTSRIFLNTIYIDIAKVPNYLECEEVLKLVNSEEFQAQLASLNDAQLIDYSHSAYLKYQVLELLYGHFEKEHIQKATALSDEFNQFCVEMGSDLKTLATFDALYEHFRKTDFNAFGWTSWPEEYQQPETEAVKTFQEKNKSRIGYFEFLQWIADSQLAEVARVAKDDGMAIGLYLDLAVGCDGGGADVWANRSVYIAGGGVGAPPDATNFLGQDWGLTPFNPVALKQQGFQPLVKALRSNMRHAGALRIDHVLGYMRQFLVPPGKKANKGIYITFPFEDMLRIIALESQRSKCVVIGEDLGTIPEGFGDIMAAAGLLSYRVLFFERWKSGLFKRPENYPEQSMITVSTHDLPTLAGWWTGTDLSWREKLNLYPDEEMGRQDRNARALDREQLIAAMIDMQVLDPKDAPATSPAVMNDELLEAVQRFLAKAPSRIQMIPLEEALGIKQQVNIPGTIEEHPNWLQKLPLSTDEIWQHSGMKKLLRAMQQERPIGGI